jgi:hypothetical protein
MRKSMLVAGIVAASLASGGTALADGPSGSPIRPIGPNQFFEGMVNGTPGSGVIRLVCPPPASGSPVRRLGHPVAGQSVSVHQLFPPTAVTSLGFTGAASTISASLLLPSASTATAVEPIALAVFAYYDAPVAIPTTLKLPCGASGVVVFDPVQGGPTARAYREPVKFPFISATSG